MEMCTPTEFTRKDAEREAREMLAINEMDWSDFPTVVKLSLMLDTVILLLSRKMLEQQTGD